MGFGLCLDVGFDVDFDLDLDFDFDARTAPTGGIGGLRPYDPAATPGLRSFL